MTALTRIITTAAFLAVLLAPLAAHAQDQKIRVSFGAGLNAGSIDGGTMFTGSAGYRFAKQFSFDVEVSGTNEVSDNFVNRVFALGNASGNFGANAPNTIVGRVGSIMPGGRDGIFGGPGNPGIPILPNISSSTDGSTMLATVGFRYEIPISNNRFQPYVGAGMGISRTDETFRVEYSGALTVPGRPGTPPEVSTGTLLDRSITHTGLLGSAGIGASLRVFRQLSLDIDARYYLLDRDRKIGRFGGGVSYRF